MSIITIKINERSSFGKAVLALLKVGVSENKLEILKTPTEETLKAMAEIKAGKVIREENADELIKKLNS